MAKVHYQSMKPAQLKQLLREAHLPTTGNNKQMGRRHAAVVQLYNSESDALEPKSLYQCAQEVVRRSAHNESAKHVESQVSVALSALTHKTPAAEIRSAQVAYLKQYKAHFAEVRTRARATRMLKMPAAEAAAHGNDNLATRAVEEKQAAGAFFPFVTSIT